MKTKKVLFFLCAIFVLFPVFSQEERQVESIGLTDSDMKNFIKNYSKIDAELEKLNYDMDTLDDSQSQEENAIILEELFRKYGISGPSALAKVILIHTDFILEHADRGLTLDPLTSALLKKASGDEDVFGGLRQTVNQQDYDLVKKYYVDLCTVFGEEPIGETKSKSKSASAKKDSDEEVKEALKETAKEEAAKAAQEEAKKALKKGIKNLLSF